MMVYGIDPGANRPVETHGWASRCCTNTKKDAQPCVSTAPGSQNP